MSRFEPSFELQALGLVLGLLGFVGLVWLPKEWFIVLAVCMVVFVMSSDWSDWFEWIERT